MTCMRNFFYFIFALIFLFFLWITSQLALCGWALYLGVSLKERFLLSPLFYYFSLILKILFNYKFCFQKNPPKIFHSSLNFSPLYFFLIFLLFFFFTTQNFLSFLLLSDLSLTHLMMMTTINKNYYNRVDRWFFNFLIVLHELNFYNSLIVIIKAVCNYWEWFFKNLQGGNDKIKKKVNLSENFYWNRK